MSDIKTQLSEQLASIEWNLIIPHAQRDAVVIVKEQLNLIDVGVALAEDDSISVQSWISQKLIYKPSPQDLSTNLLPKANALSYLKNHFIDTF